MLTVPPGVFSPVNQNKDVEAMSVIRDEVWGKTGLLAMWKMGIVVIVHSSLN